MKNNFWDFFENVNADQQLSLLTNIQEYEKHSFCNTHTYTITMLDFIEVKKQIDISKVNDLAYETWNSHYPSIIGQQQVDYILSKFQSEAAISKQISENFKYFISYKEKKSIGYFAIVSCSNSNSIQISKLYVRQSQQGSGIGSEIISFIEAYSINQGIHLLWLTVNRKNIQALNFYKKMGFNNSGSIVQNIGNGFVMDDFKMIKII